MKKLLFKSLVFIVLLACLIYAYDRMAFKANNIAHVYKEEMALIPKARIISIGNSEGIRVKWGVQNQDEIVDVCINGCDIFSTVEVFKNIADRISPNQLVIMNVNNTSFYGVNESIAKDSNAFNKTTELFYYNMPISMVNTENFVKYIKSRFYLVNSVKNTEAVGVNLLKLILPSSIYKKIKSTDDGQNEKRLNEPVEGKGFDHFALAQKGMIMDDSRNHPNVHQRAVEAVKKMLEVAKAHHITLVMYACPKNIKFQETFGQQMADSTANSLRNTIKGLQIPFYDHLYDPEFLNTKSYFHDSAHMNKTGAAHFDYILFHEIALQYPQFFNSFNFGNP